MSERAPSLDVFRKSGPRSVASSPFPQRQERGDTLFILDPTAGLEYTDGQTILKMNGQDSTGRYEVIRRNPQQQIVESLMFSSQEELISYMSQEGCTTKVGPKKESAKSPAKKAVSIDEKRTGIDVVYANLRVKIQEVRKILEDVDNGKEKELQEENLRTMEEEGRDILSPDTSLTDEERTVAMEVLQNEVNLLLETYEHVAADPRFDAVADPSQKGEKGKSPVAQPSDQIESQIKSADTKRPGGPKGPEGGETLTKVLSSLRAEALLDIERIVDPQTYADVRGHMTVPDESGKRYFFHFDTLLEKLGRGRNGRLSEEEVAQIETVETELGILAFKKFREVLEAQLFREQKKIEQVADLGTLDALEREWKDPDNPPNITKIWLPVWDVIPDKNQDRIKREYEKVSKRLAMDLTEKRKVLLALPTGEESTVMSGRRRKRAPQVTRPNDGQSAGEATPVKAEKEPVVLGRYRDQSGDLRDVSEKDGLYHWVVVSGEAAGETGFFKREDAEALIGGDDGWKKIPDDTEVIPPLPTTAPESGDFESVYNWKEREVGVPLVTPSVGEKNEDLWTLERLLAEVPDQSEFTLTSPGGKKFKYRRDENSIVKSGGIVVTEKVLANLVKKYALSVEGIAIPPNPIADIEKPEARSMEMKEGVPLPQGVGKYSFYYGSQGFVGVESSQEGYLVTDIAADDVGKPLLWSSESKLHALTKEQVLTDAKKEKWQKIESTDALSVLTDAVEVKTPVPEVAGPVSESAFKNKKDSEEWVLVEKEPEKIEDPKEKAMQFLREDADQKRREYVDIDYRQNSAWMKTKRFFGKSIGLAPGDADTEATLQSYTLSLSRLKDAELALLKEENLPPAELHERMGQMLRYYQRDEKLNLMKARDEVKIASTEKNWGHKVFAQIEQAGRAYNKMSRWKKYALAGLCLGTGAFGGLAVGGGLVAIRKLIMTAGAGVAFDTALQSRQVKKEKEGGDKQKERDLRVLEKTLQEEGIESLYDQMNSFLEKDILRLNKEFQAQKGKNIKRRVLAWAGATGMVFGLGSVASYIQESFPGSSVATSPETPTPPRPPIAITPDTSPLFQGAPPLITPPLLTPGSTVITFPDAPTTPGPEGASATEGHPGLVEAEETGYKTGSLDPKNQAGLDTFLKELEKDETQVVKDAIAKDELEGRWVVAAAPVPAEVPRVTIPVVEKTIAHQGQVMSQTPGVLSSTIEAYDRSQSVSLYLAENPKMKPIFLDRLGVVRMNIFQTPGTALLPRFDYVLHRESMGGTTVTQILKDFQGIEKSALHSYDGAKNPFHNTQMERLVRLVHTATHPEIFGERAVVRAGETVDEYTRRLTMLVLQNRKEIPGFMRT